MNLGRLRWLTILVPALALALFDYVRHRFFFSYIHAWPSTIFLTVAVFLVAYFMAHMVFTTFERRKRSFLKGAQELASLNALAAVAQGAPDLQELVTAAVVRLNQVLPAEASVVLLRGEGNGELVVAQGFSPHFEDECRRLKLGGLLPGGRFPRETAVYPGDGAISAWPLASLVREEGFRSFAAVPLRSRDRALGLALAANRRRTTARSYDRDFLAILGNTLGALVENARLHEQTQNLAVLEERDRIAREMHDSLAQVLGFLNLKARHTQSLLAVGQTEAAQRELQDMAQSAKGAYDDVREAILGLRDSISPEVGLVGNLQEYLQKFSRQTGVRAQLVVKDGTVVRFPPTWEVQLVRVIQEALTNVRKHARASNVQVTLERDALKFRVTVGDDGRGFDPSAQLEGPHFGLQTMRERVESVGGTFRVESKVGQGTRVVVELPAEPGGEP